MSEQVQNGGEYLRYSTKELLAGINAKLDSIVDKFGATQDATDRRVTTLESRVPLVDDIIRRFVQVESQVSALAQQISLHANLPHHAGSASDISTLETAVKNLQQGAAAADALRLLTRQIWVIGFGTLGALVGVAAILIQHWH